MIRSQETLSTRCRMAQRHRLQASHQLMGSGRPAALITHRDVVVADTEIIGSSPPAEERPAREEALGVRSPVPPQLHPTAQKILAAALKILTQRGYQALTLQAISAEARVNKSGVWY